MPSFQVIQNALELTQYDGGWINSQKFDSNGRIVGENGNKICPKSNGRKYTLFAKIERPYSFLERIGRILVGILAVLISCGLALCSKKIVALFDANEKIRFGIPFQEPTESISEPTKTSTVSESEAPSRESKSGELSGVNNMLSPFNRLPNEIIFHIFDQFPVQDQISLSQTCKRMNEISQTPALGLLNIKLLSRIIKFNRTVFYSYESKREDIDYPKTNFSYLKNNDKKIENILIEIKNILTKKADSNSEQYLQEAMFLYFVFKDLEKSADHIYHDNRQPDYMQKLILLLIDNGADLNTPYKYTVFNTFKILCNLWNQLKYKRELSPEQMDGLSPLTYATEFQNQYPEIYGLFKTRF